MRTLRTDVQVLRAIAVLSVLIFHFELPGLQQGFLGVDIFFVISGFLMSRVILDGLATGRFQARVFYLRRARRLLPAAFATLLATTLVAPWVLTASALRDYAWQLGGALSFSANIVLWLQSGYFDSAATLKPLLHTWSLALEEQYYFVLPLVLVLTGLRWRPLVLGGLLLASAATSLWWTTHAPSAGFYLLPARAWELLLGSLCALPGVQHWAARHAPRWDSAWLSLPLLGASLVWGWDTVHPRGDAWLVCLATAALVLFPSRFLNQDGRWLRPWVWVGDRSYSLYLVHWPLLVLARHVWMGHLPPAVSILGCLAAFPLAAALYRQVEQPFRHVDRWAALGRRMLWIGLPLAVAIGVLAFRLAQPEGQRWAQALQPNHGFGVACEYEPPFAPRAACANTPHPRTLVWGDSHAMHLIPALEASAPPGGIQQATRSVCAPLLDLARQMPDDPADRAQRCLAFNASVLDYLARTPEIEYVVLASRWQYFFEDPAVDALGQPVEPDAERIARSLQDTVARLRALHKRVILVAPPPSLGLEIDLGTCAERRALHLWTVTDALDAQCGFALQTARQRQPEVQALLDTVRHDGTLAIVDPAEFLCPNGHCRSRVDDTPLYRDATHLSRAGSARMGQALKLGPRIEQTAR